MSAYLVSREHVQYLADAATGTQPYHFSYMVPGKGAKTAEDTDEWRATFAQMLWEENAASVAHRYGDKAAAVGMVIEEELQPDDCQKHVGLIDWLQVIKAVHCYQYQACEHDDWKISEAKVATDALASFAAHMLPGYGDAEWGPPQGYRE